MGSREDRRAVARYAAGLDGANRYGGSAESHGGLPRGQTAHEAMKSRCEDCDGRRARGQRREKGEE